MIKGSQLMGRAVIDMEAAERLGKIKEIIVQRDGERVRNKLENIFNPQRSQIHGYVRADADLHVGKDLIVVPDDALIEGEPGAHKGDQKPPISKTDEADSHGWEERALAEPTRPSI